jgi:tellurite resistance protein
MLGCCMGLIAFLHVWLLRPLVMAARLQAAVLLRCLAPPVGCLLLPLISVWRFVLSAIPAIDLATLRSPLAAAFLTKQHAAPLAWPAVGAGRPSRRRYPALQEPRLAFTRGPDPPEPLGRVVRQARAMAAQHREWLAQVTVVANALSLAMANSEEKAKLREKMTQNLDNKAKKALAKAKVEEATTKKEELVASKPAYVAVELGWVERETEQLPRPKLTGRALWERARTMSLGRRHSRRAVSFMEQAKRIVFEHANDEKLIKLL